MIFNEEKKIIKGVVFFEKKKGKFLRRKTKEEGKNKTKKTNSGLILIPKG